MIDPSKFSAFVFDLDGVVWLHDQPIPGSAEALAALRRFNKPFRFLTNNASKHRSHYADKLNSMGIAAHFDEVISSGYATARYIAWKFGPQHVHVMGSEGLVREVREAGHTVVEGVDEEVGFVVCGFDQSFTYDKMYQAFVNIDRYGARFVACNTDRLYPTPQGNMPGTGANVAALSFAVGKEPEFIVGKPNQPIIDILFVSLEVPPEECLIFGDKLEQDIGVGKRAGMKTALVLSGCDSDENITAQGEQPDYILPSLGSLLEA